MYLVRPKPDLLIPMPAGGDLPAAGIVLPALDLYGVRRVSEGAVTADEVTADTVIDAVAEIAARATGADKKKG